MTDHIARDSRARSSSPSLIVSSSLVIGNHSESNDHDTFPALYSILFSTQLSPTCSQHSQQCPSGLPFTYSSLPPHPRPAKTKPQTPMHLYPLIHLLIYSLLIIRYKSISRVSRLKLFLCLTKSIENYTNIYNIKWVNYKKYILWYLMMLIWFYKPWHCFLYKFSQTKIILKINLFRSSL
jgi:hypothetical protein